MSSPSRTLTPWPSCFVCGSQDHLLRCASCKVVHYCGTEHRELDWENHKSFCERIYKAVECVDELRKSGNPDGFVDIFRLSSASALARVPTTTALKQAKQDIEKFLTSDAPTYRDQAMSLLTFVEHRLGNHDAQREAMDEWWGQQWYRIVVPLEGAYEPGFEPDEEWQIYNNTEFCYCGAAANMFEYAICKLLQRLRSRCAFQAMEDANLLRSKLPAEIVDSVKAECALDPMLENPLFRRHVITGRSVAQAVRVIDSQSTYLISEIDNANKCFWALFSNPSPYMHRKCKGRGNTAFSNALFTIITTYDAFVEIPGAVGWVLSQLEWRLNPDEVARRTHGGNEVNVCENCHPYAHSPWA